ncbi:zinc ribbon domain-containing protein [Nocardia flavorosea]|uniref:zinc ribbon domain-containing protein n=1 Tax=Nocardia flavorosea TaxID=53429 RepID=UPI002455E4EF|nr:zinc ribbon domain-containing protein [Nocardia flavorosea]
MLEEKAARYGRRFARVDRFFPSTRMCSACGAVGDKKPLHVRSWACACGVTYPAWFSWIIAVECLCAQFPERARQYWRAKRLWSVPTSQARSAAPRSRRCGIEQ